AAEIFADWEEFARYGFNKSHAADYAVISVQTACLKAHYPVEYMTALLSVFLDNTDKVAAYVADCRRMGIEVLPPNINTSEWDFTIEGQGKDAVIRFGLGAVKNVGHNPVDLILEARTEKKFADLNDFIRRADLRKVGKRALECLVKVGALENFGPRPAVLNALDRIISISSSYFAAAESGQMTMFDPQTGLDETIELSSTAIEIPRREQLDWERELIGVYISDHPLSPVMEAIDQNITHYSTELSDLNNEQVVRVAGLVTRIRPHTTKKGNPMGFATIEDLHGDIDLVIFPRSWGKYRDLIDFDNIILVTGKVDNSRGEPKIIVDRITSELNHVTPLKESPAPQQGEKSAPLRQASVDETVDTPPAKTPPRVAESPKDYGDAPPPPDAFPSGWGQANNLTLKTDSGNGKQNPPPTEDDAPSSQPQSAEKDRKDEISPQPQGEESSLNLHKTEVETEAPRPPVTEVVTPLLPPLPPADSDDARMLTVILRPQSDKVRNSFLMRRIYGELIRRPGNDRFSFHIFENRRSYLLDFPNFTTLLDPEFITELRNLVGPENVRVETITFQ
ncbi:MAG: OB-fold nucleic acid binding domain-containing protein, partial [Chloroflexota bacterium]|nr:OB-fold nucleic acid binding domain-containing protein [Chloroflexota bacterium]